MVDTALLPAIRAAIKRNELGSASPYHLSFARLGSSGASFGIFQGDTHVNPAARATLRQALQEAGADTATCNRILAAVSQSCPQGNPLSGEDTGLANGALSSDAGRRLVDKMDADLLVIVLNELDSCIAAAATSNRTIAPDALLYIALWVNMSGAPTTLDKWLSGTAENGVDPPAGPTVLARDLEAYLQATAYFRAHAKNFKHMQDSASTALALLPAGLTGARNA